MKLVIQRVTNASVDVDGVTVGKIGKGFLVFVGVGSQDTKEKADKFLKKMLGLRIFEDEAGKTNLSLHDVNGELLLISQFTLYANCRKETARVSQKPVLPIWQMNCMNIWSQRQKNRYLSLKKGYLVLI